MCLFFGAHKMKPTLIEYGQEFELLVEAEAPQERVDVFLHQQFPAYTRSFFNRAIEDGYVKVNEKVVTKSGHKIKAGDNIYIMFPKKREITADMVKDAHIPVNVVFKHPHFIIIEKPAGLLAHPTTSTSKEVSLSDWLLHNIDDIAHVGSVDRPGIIHRLDKLTSGLMIIPRTNYAYAQFGEMFRNRTVNKTYYAIVKGHPPKKSSIDLLIGRHPVERNRMTTYPSLKEAKTKSRHAVTHYEVEQYFEDEALVRVKLETGRTHQIRVHFAAIDHSIIGDPVYGKKTHMIGRQALHAAELSFDLDGKNFKIKSELPEDIKKLISQLQPIEHM